MTSSQQASVAAPVQPPPGVARNVAEAFGQVVWLLSQSPLHRELKIKDLEWSFMPPIIHEQFRVFRFGPLPGMENVDPKAFAPMGMSKEAFEQLPLGIAIWAKLSEAAEAKLEKGEKLTLEEWRSGDRVWLVELISPFANPANKLSEAMLMDLIQGPFKSTAFSLHRTDPKTGRKDKILVASHINRS
jgi:cytolysin-activating lysine-acyltransferase